MNLTAPTTAPPAMGPPAILAESQKALPAMGPPQMHIQFRPQRQQQQPQRALFVPAVDVNPAGVNFAAEVRAPQHYVLNMFKQDGPSHLGLC